MQREHNSNEFMSFPIENPNPQTDTDLLQQVRIIVLQSLIRKVRTCSVGRALNFYSSKDRKNSYHSHRCPIYE